MVKFLLPVLLAWGAALTAQADSGPSPINVWNEQALITVREERLTDAQAARLYAMVNVAMYDAVNGIDAHRGSQERAYALVRPDGAPSNGDRSAAASAAAFGVLSQMFPGRSYQAAYDAALASVPSGNAGALGTGWGAYVAGQVILARQNDGSLPNESKPGSNGPGEFRASWSGVQFRNLAPFAIADPSRYITAGPPPLQSTRYAASLAELRVLGNAAIPDQALLDTYNWWASSAGTSQPPGEWIKVAMIISNQATQPLTLSDSARLFALLGMALSDVVAPTYATKFRYHSWRPATAIQNADIDGNPFTDADPTWQPRAGTVGGSPEHISGHSSFAGAATTVLRLFFGRDDITFKLRSDSRPNEERTFNSLRQAESEVGRSRMYGGIHFSFSNEAGLELGRGVGEEVMAMALQLKTEKENDD